MRFKSKNASKTPFREPSPAISHLLNFALSPAKTENNLKVFIRFLTDNKSLRKYVESSEKAVYKNPWLKIVTPLVNYFWLIQRELIKQLQTCMPIWDHPGVQRSLYENPLFIKHDSWSFNNIFIQYMKFSQKPNFFKILNRKSWSKESNTLSKCIVTR